MLNKDTLSIFRTLTKGCNFKPDKKLNSEKRKRKLSDSEIKIEIKQEKIEDVEETEYAQDSRDNANNSIALLSSMGYSEDTGKKPKKQKIFDEAKQIALEQEKINEYRNKQNIKIIGRHVPDPVKSFTDMDLKTKIFENLRLCGYSEPTPIQQQAIPIMMAGRQIMALAPTGSGKTLCFLLPILKALKKPKKIGFRAVILCPTRELAKQTQRIALRVTEGLGFHIHIMSNINRAIKQYGEKTSGKYDILITTPNRLCFLLKKSPPAINLSNVEWLVADEADKYFEDSTNGFQDQFQTIYNACSLDKRKIAFFAATYTPKAVKWCVHNMKGLIRVTVGTRNSAVDLVDQKLVFVGGEAGKLLEFRNMIHTGFEPPVLIFVQSKERAEELHKELMFDNLHIGVIHGDLNQDERDTAIRKFREGEIWVLICTELMSRGIDFKGVNLVLNWDLPQTTISYIHRVGRAGRAGRRGKAITFYTQEDLEFIGPIGFIIKESGSEVPDFILKLKKPNKKKKKHLRVSVPKREQISTTPKYKPKKERFKKKNKTK